MSESAGNAIKAVGDAFKSDGAIGSNFNADGAIGGTAQAVGGPFDKDGAVGKQFDLDIFTFLVQSCNLRVLVMAVTVMVMTVVLMEIRWWKALSHFDDCVEKKELIIRFTDKGAVGGTAEGMGQEASRVGEEVKK
ncbi:hypothetical protein TREMEDRAFT_61364 [Tremella mesenterica DSM 1558]|uniref:uncharacterized protein n=1 Tax=Tremella mesenterica (strain ATCC 24925 / CBS 8224 / DSM 1558 / NBRC 9311 / NRRL Y-6157 / RJB 2259-6 / UBC 559-6) TaxID=578456 RepID=UPI0003F49B96|nr:uncharacterized protein TREMEDRAFT_61364 [Tremella mesenterica DSM 1558]EIW70853.1 hypothetical protein TREMEDRAFT_61364 [Tremella mesenterica DSM 1558]